MNSKNCVRMSEAKQSAGEGTAVDSVACVLAKLKIIECIPHEISNRLTADFIQFMQLMIVSSDNSWGMLFLLPIAFEFYTMNTVWDTRTYSSFLIRASIAALERPYFSCKSA